MNDYYAAILQYCLDNPTFIQDAIVGLVVLVLAFFTKRTLHLIRATITYCVDLKKYHAPARDFGLPIHVVKDTYETACRDNTDYATALLEKKEALHKNKTILDAQNTTTKDVRRAIAKHKYIDARKKIAAKLTTTDNTVDKIELYKCETVICEILGENKKLLEVQRCIFDMYEDKFTVQSIFDTYRYALSLSQNGVYSEAKHLLCKVIKFFLANNMMRHYERSRLNLGILLLELGKHKAGLYILDNIQKSITSKKILSNMENNIVIYNIARSYYNMGMYINAIPLLITCVANGKGLAKSNYEKLYTIIMSVALAKCYMEKAEYDLATKISSEAYNYCVSNFKNNNYILAMIEYIQADLCLQLGHYDSAIDICDKYIKILGKDYASSEVMYNLKMTLLCVLIATEKFTKARVLCEGIIAEVRQEHIRGVSYRHMGEIYLGENKLLEALKAYKVAYKILRSGFPSNHNACVTTLTQIAKIYRLLGNIKKSTKLYSAILAKPHLRENIGWIEYRHIETAFAKTLLCTGELFTAQSLAYCNYINFYHYLGAEHRDTVYAKAIYDDATLMRAVNFPQNSFLSPLTHFPLVVRNRLEK